MIISARSIHARASIVRCPTVRMPVPTTTRDPTLFVLVAMPYPTGGNTAIEPPIAVDIPRRIGAVAAPRTAVDISRAAAPRAAWEGAGAGAGPGDRPGAGARLGCYGSWAGAGLGDRPWAGARLGCYRSGAPQASR